MAQPEEEERIVEDGGGVFSLFSILAMYCWIKLVSGLFSFSSSICFEMILNDDIRLTAALHSGRLQSARESRRKSPQLNEVFCPRAVTKVVERSEVRIPCIADTVSSSIGVELVPLEISWVSDFCRVLNEGV